jgi:hypothetical protein
VKWARKGESISQMRVLGDGSMSVSAWRPIDEELLLCGTNLTCKIECVKLKNGLYREDTGECMRYEYLKRICITIEFEETELDDDEASPDLYFSSGCFSDGEIGFY